MAIELTIKQAEGSSTVNYAVLEHEVNYLKEHLSKLKFNYIEMETKRGFLSKLDDMSFVQSYDEQTSLVQENELQLKKSFLKGLKQQEIDLRSEIQHLSDELVEFKRVWESSEFDTIKMKEDICILNNELLELEKLTFPDEGLSLADAQSLLAEQNSEIQRLVCAIEKQKEANEERKLMLKHIIDETQSSLQIKSESELKADKIVKQLGLRDRKIDDLFNWYKNAAEFITSLTGVSVRDFTDNSVILDFDTGRKSSITIKVVNEEIAIEVSRKDVLIDDIVSYFKLTSDYVFLLREVRARFEACDKRFFEFDELSTKWDVKIDDNLVGLRSKLTGKEFVFELERDYPNGCRSFHLIDSDDEVLALKRKFESEQPDSIKMALDSL